MKIVLYKYGIIIIPLNNDCVFSGRGVSIWDKFAHDGKIKNRDSGDVAADSYHKYKEDIQLLRHLKVKLACPLSRKEDNNLLCWRYLQTHLTLFVHMYNFLLKKCVFPNS